MKMRVLRFVIIAIVIVQSFGAPRVASGATTWVTSFTSPGEYIKALAVYNGKLYAGGGLGNQTDAHLYVYDGSNWTDLNFATTLGIPVNMIESLQVFNGRLYIGARVLVDVSTYARVYYYDGTTFTQDLSTSGIAYQSGIEDLTVHNGYLYALKGISNGEVFQRIGDGNWSSVGGAFTGGVMPRSLASFKRDLYLGTGAGGAIVRKWNGSTWEIVTNITTLFGIGANAIWSMAANDDTLFVGPVGTMAVVPSIIPAFDCTNLSTSLSVSGNVTRLAEIDGQIWAGTLDGKIYRNNGAWQEYGVIPKYAFDFTEYQGDIYAAGSNGVVYRATAPKPWLLMYYMAGDNNLSQIEKAAVETLKAIRNENAFITILEDLSDSTSKYIAIDSNGSTDFLKAELNTGDYQTQIDFMVWAKANYPAKHTALIIIDHGNALAGVAQDDLAITQGLERTLIKPNELKAALSSTGKVDVINSYTCLMANLEAEYQLRGLTDYYVGSENENWFVYSDERRIEDVFNKYVPIVTGSTTPEQLAISMAESYYLTIEPQDLPSNISVVDMSKIDNVAAKTSTLAQTIREWFGSTKYFIWSITESDSLQRFDETGDGVIDNEDVLADLYDFASMARGEPLLLAAANNLISALNEYVIYNKFWSGTYVDDGITYEYFLNDSHGVSIGLPRSRISYYKDEWLDFAEGADWVISPLGPSFAHSETLSGLSWGPFISDLVKELTPMRPIHPTHPHWLAR